MNRAAGFVEMLNPRRALADTDEEAELYLHRAKLAASEERFDDARVFCEKALAIAPGNLHALFVLARLEEIGFRNRDGALTLYQRIIAWSGYESANPYCSAARTAIARLASVSAPA